NASEYIPFINEAYIDRTGEPLYPNPKEVLNRVGPNGINWIDEMVQIGSYTDLDLAVSGGNENFTYRVSGSVVDQEGIVINTTYKRYQARLNMTKKVNPQLDMGIHLNLSRSFREPGSNIDFGSN